MRILFVVILSLLGLSQVSAQNYCQPTGVCGGDSLLFVEMDGHQIIPSGNCLDVYYNPTDTLYITTGGGVLTTQNARFIDATVGSWVDWSQNFQFESTEYLPMVGNANTGFTITLLPPNGIVDGTYRLRLKLWYILEAATNDTNACWSSASTYQNVDINLKVVDEIPTPDPIANNYCAASGEPDCASVTTNGTTTDTTFTFIDRVSIQADASPINNITNCDVYGDFTNLIADWTVGNTYMVTVSAGTGDSSVSNNLAQIGAVYIDWNKDTVFGPEETFNLGPNSGDSMFVNIIPPVDGATGLYRMRVRTVGLLNTPEPCGAQAIGEVEDYTILLRSLLGGEPACVTTTSPADGSRDNCTSSIITWNAAEGATNYTLRLTPKNGDNQYNIQTTDTFFIPNQGLFADTTYRMFILPDANGTAAFGCDTLEFTTASILDPVASITPSDDTVFTCKGSNIPFQGTANYPGSLTHTWSDPASSFLSSTSIENPVYNNPNEDTLRLVYEVRNSFACGGFDTTVVVTLDGAQLDDFFVVDETPCEYDSLFVVIKGAKGSILVEDSLDGGSWVNANPVSLNDTLFFLPGINQGNHFVRLSVILGDCDVMISPIAVTFTPSPTKPIISFFDGSDGTACRGEGIGMRVENYEPTMRWNDAGSTANDTLFVDGSADFVVINTVNGCVSVSDTLKPRSFDNPTPTIERFPTSGPCIGDPLTLSVEGFASQKWNVPTADSLNSSVEVTMDGTYTVDVVDVNGCKGSASTNVTFFAKPSAPVLTQLDPDPACAGSTIRLVASYTTTGQWSTGSTQDTLFVTTAGSYIYSSISAEGCKTDASDSLEIEFFDSGEAVSVTVTPEAPYCIGDSVYLISEFATGNSWNTGSTNDTIVAKANGIYFVESFDGNNCARRSRDIELIFGDVPAKPEILVNGQELTSSITGLVYEWTRNGVPLNINKKTIVVNRVGTYRLSVFNGSGCESEVSDPVVVNTVGIVDLEQSNFVIYPNPSHGKVFNLSNDKELITEIAVLSTDGKTILNQRIDSLSTSFSVPNSGNYILVVKTKNNIYRSYIIAL